MSNQNKVKGANATKPWWHRLTLRQITAVLLAILAVIFIGQNRQEATVSLLFVTVTLPLWITLACATVVGIAVGWLAHRRSA
ncbi:lipopolysaccharide assembly protein LapA domain-containing protein [Arthrobacter antioxidans]|uniref:lipopolysaccharide assembly protein LapA domain-containing protein n=1 Tax=Arthrobacter antioxidans TaxID=2895818 RepID=UPI001FFEE6AD|nr:LapA family protein [Arthrobacter antioxidans]